METQNFLKSKSSRFLWGMVLVFSIIILAKSGYLFGQWLYNVIN